MTDATPRLSLPWLMPAQAQKHVTVNESLGRLDALLHCAVVSRSIDAEPGAPAEGEAWILPDGANGAHWDGFYEADIAYFQDGAWSRIAARAGLTAWVADEGELCVYDGAVWTPIPATITALSNLSGLGVGTAPDATNAFAAKLNSALWTALYTGEGGTGDLRYTLNKQSPSATVSFLFQSDWSGRAEIGLTGSNGLSLRVSPDGANWTDGLSVASDGKVGVNTSNPTEALDINADAARLRTARTPASASAPGAPGTICWDADYVYVCVAADTWKRAALSAW